MLTETPQVGTGFFEQVLKNGQHKGNGFSGTGLGQAKDIFPVKNGGNCKIAKDVKLGWVDHDG